MRIAIIVASVTTLIYFGTTKVIQDSKSKVKDSIKDPKAKTNNKVYNELMLQFYDLFLQSNITSIVTIVVFFGGMVIRYLTKIKITIKFILKLLILGLLISFITVASTINSKLNEEVLIDDNFYTVEETLINQEKEFRDGIKNKNGVYTTKPDEEFADKYKNLLLMLNVCRATGYISFGLMTFLLVTEIYK
tara:strand:+ start:11601 stop:12173 length:573 start_codon:yes stop_codon:yes gene_type:complete